MNCWYNNLKKAQEVTVESNGIIVAKDVIFGDKVIKNYTNTTMTEYMDFLRRLSVNHQREEWNQYELIRGGTSPHRFYVDIDGKVEDALSSEEDKSKWILPYITTISKILIDHVKLKGQGEFVDLYVYSSCHGSKASFHIITTTIMNSSKMSRNICNRIIKLFNEEYSRVECEIDSEIYNRNRCLRSIYSRKINTVTERTKIPFRAYRRSIHSSSLVILEPSINEYIDNSIVQNLNVSTNVQDINEESRKANIRRRVRSGIVRDPKDTPITPITPIISIESKINKLNNSKFIKDNRVLYSVNKEYLSTEIQQRESSRNVKDYMKNNTEKIYEKYSNFARKYNMPVMELREVNETIMTLSRRQQSGHCVVCDTIHDNENAFLTVAPGSHGAIRLYYRCYRNNQDSMEII